MAMAAAKILRHFLHGIEDKRRAELKEDEISQFLHWPFLQPVRLITVA